MLLIETRDPRHDPHRRLETIPRPLKVRCLTLQEIYALHDRLCEDYPRRVPFCLAIPGIGDFYIDQQQFYRNDQPPVDKPIDTDPVLIKLLYDEIGTFADLPMALDDLYDTSFPLIYQSPQHTIMIKKQMVVIAYQRGTYVFHKDKLICYLSSQHCIYSNQSFSMSLTATKQSVSGWVLYHDDNFFRQPNKSLDITITKKDQAIEKQYTYHNQTSRLTLSSFTRHTPTEIVSVQRKNDLFLFTHQRARPATTVHYSQCMISDNETRYRGTYKQTTSNGKTETVLTRDNDTVYHRVDENDEETVLINHLENKLQMENNIRIGWKVVKSIRGELRILKLGILKESQIVQAVDIEFFSTRGKQRCDRAIVMDIQYPEQEERTVVPDEMRAYSYLFSQQPIISADRSHASTAFCYEVGKEVVPDQFDSDDKQSCSHGIHFFASRNDVFNVYINR
jgi:hypothetical protein